MLFYFTSYIYKTAKFDSSPSALTLSIRNKKMKSPFVAFLLIFVLLLSNSFIEPTMGLGRSLYCIRKCKGRCAKAGVRDRCLKYCNICCEECKCVPSGTYGNKHECPCYRDKRNSKGKPKCP